MLNPKNLNGGSKFYNQFQNNNLEILLSHKRNLEKIKQMFRGLNAQGKDETENYSKTIYLINLLENIEK